MTLETETSTAALLNAALLVADVRRHMASLSRADLLTFLENMAGDPLVACVLADTPTYLFRMSDAEMAPFLAAYRHVQNGNHDGE